MFFICSHKLHIWISIRVWPVPSVNLQRFLLGIATHHSACSWTQFGKEFYTLKILVKNHTHPLNSYATKAMEINSTITTQILPLHMTDSYRKLYKILKRPSDWNSHTGAAPTWPPCCLIVVPWIHRHGVAGLGELYNFWHSSALSMLVEKFWQSSFIQVLHLSLKVSSVL